MQNAVIYARYSCSAQTEQSIEGQLRDCYEFAKRENLCIVGEYIDRALSGRSDDRPEFQRMVEDAKNKQFQYIIVYKLDRFARNRYDSAVYKHKLRQVGVKVLSAMENISDAPEGIILEAVLEASAEYYSKDLSQKVKRGMRESALKGSSTGGVTPTGYKIMDKKVFIDEAKAEMVRFFFEQYAKGVAKKDIIKQLNEKGFCNTNGKEITIHSFSSVLKNKKYIGTTTYDGVEYPNTYPPIIDVDTFNKVQERIQHTKRAPAAAKARVEYLLSGKGFCGLCGAKLIGESGRSKSGNNHYYYACGVKKKLHTCKKQNEKKDFLEWYIVEQTLEYVLTPPRMNYIAELVVKAYDEEFNDNRIKEFERRIAKLDAEINKCVDIMLETSSKAIKSKMEEKAEMIELQKTDLEIDLSKLKIANTIRYTKTDILAWLKLFCNGDLMDADFRRRIIDVFVNSIYLYDDKVVIYYNIRNSKQISYIDMHKETNTAINTDNGTNNSVRISNDLVSHRRLERRTP